jgi:metal-sulfur cluster biosynthetic enzyme
MVTESQIREALMDVVDPEIGIDIINLGLVYGIDVSEDGKTVQIVMTLTAMGCPAGDMIREQVRQKVLELGVEHVNVDIVWSPPWSKDMMTEEGKTMLKYLF